jgi:hypothetical protein
VEVFDRQDQRVAGGQRLNRVGQLAQHPIPYRPHEPLLKRGRLAWCEEARELGEPHRRVPLELLDRLVAGGTPAQSHQSVEDRLVRLAAPVLLDAIAPRHGDAIALAHARKPFGQDGTLTDAGLTADQA